MINIFDILNDIITTKKGDLLDDVDNEEQFSPYLICRWLSMYSPEYAYIINKSVNKYYSVFETKQDWYQYLIKILPKGSPGRIFYIKKQKRDKVDDYDVAVNLLSKKYEISKREIQQYIDTGLVDVNRLKMMLK